MTIKDRRVYLNNPAQDFSAESIKLKTNGWLGVNKDGDGWTYYPPNRVERVVPE